MVTQLVEYNTFNVGVMGSSPIHPTNFSRVAQWWSKMLLTSRLKVQVLPLEPNYFINILANNKNIAYFSFVMCSFLFSTKLSLVDIDEVNFFLKPRGPDGTTVKTINGHLYLHNLLHITGEKTPQPLQDKEIHVLYNGEIYNYKSFGDYDNDSKCLIPLYQQLGQDFVKHLDGEFSLCLIDYEKQIAIVSTDVFKTKPLFFSLCDGHFGCSTYRTPLSKLGLTNIQKAKANTTYVICLKTLKIVHQQSVYDFDINQHKTNFDDWIIAFEQSISKRTSNVNFGLFMGLSSGYDSGIIFSELLKQKVPSLIISFVGRENKKVLKDRTDKAINFMELSCNDFTNTIYKCWIKTHTEPFEYHILNNSGDLLTDDQSAVYFAQLCKQGKLKGCKILLSGTGGDEILSNYDLEHFNEVFPQDLKTMFPWPNFYDSKMEAYLAHDEYIGGVFGLEVRYPLLDKRLVQEFLWLSSDLKNQAYKAPIKHYFDLNNVSYKQEKIGFSL